MPLVEISMYAGRTAEQKRELAEVITREMQRICGARPSATTIIFTDVKPEDWMNGAPLVEAAKG
ncbi:tautomerase family protein [Radicibacter daui]|uniref:tautomerase family protein n=1 Tax=Radicibacter daui TaxID=3064829 RepID=UPI004046A6A0